MYVKKYKIFLTINASCTFIVIFYNRMKYFMLM